MILHLGVLDVPYGDTLKTKPRPGSAAAIGSNRMSTGDVAEVLEHRYGIMAKFFELREEDVADAVAEAMLGKLEGLLAGAQPEGELLSSADLSAIQEMFQEMLDKEAFAGLIEGVPTGAARAGVNHRLAHPYAKANPPRPSFIDTGLFSTMFRAWVDD